MRSKSIGVERTSRMIGTADILLWLGDGDAPDRPRTIKVHAKADLEERQVAPEGSVSISSLTGSGIGDLLLQIERAARTLIPADDAITLNRRHAKHIGEAADALSRGAQRNGYRSCGGGTAACSSAFDRLTGRAGVEDVLDALFARFCLGK